MVKTKTRFLAIFILLLGFFAAYFDSASVLNKNSLFAKIPFKLGLDLKGGVHLVYSADTSKISSKEVSSAMNGLRDVIERRINFFGVTEPLVQVEKSGGENRLIVELPGIKNVNQAIKLIGETPYLEFRTQRPTKERDEILEAQKKGERLNEDPYFVPTPLTGRYLKKAYLNFNQTTFQPEVSLEFTKEGADLFAKITKENIGKPLAIYLDGAPISTPVVKEEIKGGRAEITGKFTPQEAKELVTRLNSGALPIPIKLISQQTIGPTLGEKILHKGIVAGTIGVLAVALFLLLLYRFLGLIAVSALGVYTALVLALYKLIPVTLTAAGIAGFILSIGVAVDANILIFERTREELRQGKHFVLALSEGFSRAWTSIRDSNISTLITASILYWFSTSMVKGFALTLGVGVLVSLFSSFTVTRTFLFALNLSEPKGRISKFLLGFPKLEKAKE